MCSFRIVLCLKNVTSVLKQHFTGRVPIRGFRVGRGPWVTGTSRSILGEQEEPFRMCCTVDEIVSLPVSRFSGCPTPSPVECGVYLFLPMCSLPDVLVVDFSTVQMFCVCIYFLLFARFDSSERRSTPSCSMWHINFWFFQLPTLETPLIDSGLVPTPHVRDCGRFPIFVKPRPVPLGDF